MSDLVKKNKLNKPLFLDSAGYISTRLKDVRDLNDLAKLLNQIEREFLISTSHLSTLSVIISEKNLQYFIENSNDHYQVFKIKKKSGGYRIIHAPSSRLKRIQSILNFLLQVYFYPNLNYYMNGFVYGRSISRNALPHVRKRFVLNMDIENFFPSISKSAISKAFMEPPFSLDSRQIQIIDALSELCTLKGVLPQGAPTSPILSAVVTQVLDEKLSEYARVNRVRYSRYADDITFSSNLDVFTPCFIENVNDIVNSQGFSINTKKTNLRTWSDRQVVTGLVVNAKLNVKREFLKNLRAILFNWEKNGYQVAQRNMYRIERNQSSLKDVVRGRVDFIGQVRGVNDPLYLRLKRRFELVKNRVEFNTITNDRVRLKLESDNRSMELEALVEESSYVRFCTMAFYQIENILKFYYHERFKGDFNHFVDFMFENSDYVRNRYKDKSRYNIKEFKKVNMELYVYLYEKEFFFDKKKSYDKIITILRKVRNDDSHRCEVEGKDKDKILMEYNTIRKLEDDFMKRKGRARKLLKNEKEVKSDYNLIKFIERGDKTIVRNAIREMVLSITSNLSEKVA